MKNLKNQKGITLVALVITIIVLLILAGISLNLVMGEGGILNRATGAVSTNKMAEAKEQVSMVLASYVEEYYEVQYVNNNGTAPTGGMIGFIHGKATNKQTAGNYKFTVSDTGALTVYETVNETDTVIYTGTISNTGVIINFS